MTAVIVGGSPATALEVRDGAFVFADVVGFTAYTATNGDGFAYECVEALERLTLEVLPAGARLVKMLGDGVLCWCASSAEAIGVALTLLDRFGTEPPLHAAVHYGRAVVRGDDLVGHDVNVTARLADVAPSGHVICSDAAWRQASIARPSLRARRVGPTRVKGVAKAVNVWCVAR